MGGFGDPGSEVRFRLERRFQGRVLHVQIASDVRSFPPPLQLPSTAVQLPTSWLGLGH